MKALVLVSSLALLLGGAQLAAAQGNNCSFPGQGIGVGGTPGNPGASGTFPGGGATGGVFPGGNCGGGATVSTAEPLSLFLVGGALLGAAALKRRRR